MAEREPDCSEDDEFAEQIRRRTLKAFGVRDFQAGMAPVPWYARLWRSVTFAYRRGKAVDWRSYNAAEAEFRDRQEAFKAALPGQLQEIADELSSLLPDGMRFEWAADDETPDGA